MIFYEEIKFTAYLSHFSTKTTYENNLHPIRHFQLIQNFSRNRTFFYSLEVFKILKLILLVIFIYCISFQPLFPTSEFFLCILPYWYLAMFGQVMEFFTENILKIIFSAHQTHHYFKQFHTVGPLNMRWYWIFNG